MIVRTAVSFAVYLQMLLCGVIYCIPALPVLCFVIVAAGFNREKIAATIRRLIVQFGKVMIFFAVKPWIRVCFEDVSEDGTSGLTAVYIMNHRSASDPFLMAAVPTDIPLVQAVNGWPMRLPFFGFFARHGEYLDVTREPYEQIRKKSLDLLRRGIPIFVFPEGTRSGGQVINAFHGTFFRIAKEAGVPVIPVAIAGNEKIPDLKFRISTGTIRIRRLPPIPANEVKSTALYPLKERIRTILILETKRMDEEMNHEK